MTELGHKKGLRKGEILLSKDSNVWKILEALVKSDEKSRLNVKELKEITHQDYAYCHKRLKLLQRRGLVEEKGKKKGPKGDVSVYDLTLPGLVVYLTISQYQDFQEKKMGSKGEKRSVRIVEKYASLLPQVLGEWKYFETASVQDIVFENFKVEVDSIYRQFITEGLKHTVRSPLDDEIQTNTLLPWLTDAQLGMWPSAGRDEPLRKLQTAIRKNESIWNYLKPKILEVKQQTEKILEKLDSILD